MIAMTDHENDLTRYVAESRKYPLLTVEQEQDLARRWRDRRDPDAIRQLVGSHMRLVIKIARSNRGYGLPMNDLISEGMVGLMQAAERFDPDRGFRFATYGSYWIKQSMNRAIGRNTPVRVPGQASEDTRRVRAAMRASTTDKSFAVVTITAPEIGAICVSVSAASPVPGGRSMTR